jgi:hypothetical protein
MQRFLTTNSSANSAVLDRVTAFNVEKKQLYY